MDFIRQLGMLAIASRMKRLTERFMRGGSEVYEALDINFEPRWFTVFYLLNSQNQPMSISEIAQALKISHPAVIQTTKMLTRRGLVRSFQDDEDRRKRQLVVTQKGREMGSVLQPVWDDFEAATAEMFESAGVDMLDMIEKIESALDEAEISERILARIKERQYSSVEILEYDEKYREHFERLNREWLEKHFEVEETDRKMLSNPKREIIQKGGEILFARLEGEIVGTAALLKAEEETWEIAKMAVDERVRGRQVGKKLTQSVVTLAKSKGAKNIILRTDNRLRAAVNLYRQMGFRIIHSDRSVQGLYRRARYGILMELELK